MKFNKTALLTSFGAGLEYYDFIVYAFLAQYISNAFFPGDNQIVSIINSFGLFAVGYIVRPVGGVIFGAFGDKYGRKKVFLISILLMAVTTLLIGCIPTYKTFGIFATIIIVILRILQGISFGAELPGATTFISEHSEKNMRGLNCAIMVSFVTLGVLLGSFVVYILTEIFGNNVMERWGWRIPFFIGGGLAVIAYFIRTNTKESPYYENNTTHRKHPFLWLIIKYPKHIVKICGFIAFPAVLVMFALCMPVYFSLVYGYKPSDVYFAISLGYGWSIISLLIFGIFSDKFNRKIIFIITVAVFFIVCLFYFNLLAGACFLNLVIFIIIYQTFISLCTICYYPMIAENFPTEVRFTGIALCYNFVYAIASLIPMIVSFLYELTENSLVAPGLLMFFAVISILSAFFVKDYTGKEMQ